MTRHMALAPFIFLVACQAALAPPAGAERQRRTLNLGLNMTAALDLDDEVRDVIVANPAVAEAVVRTARRVYLIGHKIGETNALFIGKDGVELMALSIRVERDLAPVNAIFARLMPEARIRAEALNGDILLSGSVQSPADAARAADIASRFAGGPERVLNMLDVTAREQVLLKVRVAEINRGAMRRLGADVKQITASLKNLRLGAGAETGFAVTGASVPGAALGAAGLVSPAAGGAMTAIWSAGGASFAALLEAMERINMVKMLAEPSLAAISGETANFLAGGEIPIPVSRDKDAVNVEWKQFGVSLAFTPVVLSEGRISLKIATEVSDLSAEGAVMANGFSIPSLQVRRASSTVELPSGGSLVLAGLLSDTARRSAEGLPGLRDLPVLGRLFESRDFTRAQTELIIIVTPHLARPVDEKELSLPHAGHDSEAWRPTVSAMPPAQHESRALFGFGFPQ